MIVVGFRLLDHLKPVTNLAVASLHKQSFASLVLLEAIHTTFL